MAPGTVTAWALVRGISVVRPAAFSAATLAAIGARPLPFMATVGLPAGA